MKSSTVVGGILALAVVGGGIAYLATRESKPKDPRQVLTQQLGGPDGNLVWSFSIAQAMPSGIMANIHGPDGAFASKEAAHTAGVNWLAAHPLV